MNVQAHCGEPASVSNPRGAQNAPRTGAAYRPPAGPHYRSPVVASYDPATGKLSWGGKVDPALGSPGTPAPATLGEESWKWLFLQPLVKTQE